MTCSRCGEVCSCVPDEQTSNPAIRPSSPSVEETTTQTSLLAGDDGSSWRQEVSERLHRYHARRRPRAPRYPSLRLKFENPDANWTSSAREAPLASHPAPATSPVTRQSVAMNYADLAPSTEASFRITSAEPAPIQERPNEVTAKIIEFPRSSYAPPMPLYELAEPILDRPRILEAPEVVPPPPALGGMTIEETAKAEPERRPGIDMPLQSAPTGHRLAAMAIDAIVVLLAGAAFGAVFYRITSITPTPLQGVTLGAALLSVFWAAYQYLLIVYSGATAGLRAMKLRVERFDGKPPARRLRRWRVLCSLLSALSLGMGYAWRFLDEDGLCWHERVTRTHIAPDQVNH